jgi:4-amino-4-deoxy-L-arabinose transferase-like glycosyltransferase
MGARIVGQFVAALGAATSAYLLAVGHLLTTSTLDALVWTTALLLVTRILAGGDERLWLAVGIAFAVGLENKALPLLLALAIAIGLLLDRRLVAVVRSPWLWGGVAVAVVAWLPWLVWQARHGWPQLELARDIRRDDGTESRATLIPLQFVLLSPLLAPVVALGLWGLMRDSSLRPWRSLGYAYVALLVVVFVTAGKPYYAAPVLLFLLAPGSISLERWLNTARRRVSLAFILVVSAVVSALVVLPILPADRIGGTPIPDLNEDAIETIGWPQLVGTVADVYARIPDPQRRSAVVFAGNYGEAGAIDRYGAALGLPRAYSAHNAFARFGIPPDDDGPVIVLGYHDPSTHFSGCRSAATIDNRADVNNEEQGGSVFVCAKPRAPWAVLWNQIDHLDA